MSERAVPLSSISNEMYAQEGRVPVILAFSRCLGILLQC